MLRHGQSSQAVRWEMPETRFSIITFQDEASIGPVWTLTRCRGCKAASHLLHCVPVTGAVSGPGMTAPQSARGFTSLSLYIWYTVTEYTEYRYTCRTRDTRYHVTQDTVGMISHKKQQTDLTQKYKNKAHGDGSKDLAFYAGASRNATFN